MSSGQIKDEAKALLQEDPFKYITVTLVVWLTAYLTGLVLVAVPLLGFIFSYILMTSGQVLYKRLLLRWARGQELEVDSDIVQPLWNESFSFAGTKLLQQFYLVMWSFCFILPAFHKWISYALTDYLMNDYPNLRYNDAITASRILMRGHHWSWLKLKIRFIPWYILSGLTAGILQVYVAPYQTFAEIQFYERLRSEWATELAQWSTPEAQHPDQAYTRRHREEEVKDPWDEF